MFRYPVNLILLLKLFILCSDELMNFILTIIIQHDFPKFEMFFTKHSHILSDPFSFSIFLRKVMMRSRELCHNKLQPFGYTLSSFLIKKIHPIYLKHLII